MTKIIISDKLRQELDGLFDAINHPMLKESRNHFETKLSKIVDSNKVKSILDKEETIDILDKDEAIAFFESLRIHFKKNEFSSDNIKFAEDVTDTKKGLYNEDFKEEYLSKYKDNTRRVKRIIFEKSRTLELTYGKDLYDFNFEQLEEVLRSLKASTVRSLQNSVATIAQYTKFAIKNKKKSDKINYIDGFTKDKIEEYLDKEREENMIFPKEEIMSIATEAENPQDGVILALIFDGVSNKNEFEELINLSEDDIDFDEKVIKLEDREVPMSEDTCELVKDAIHEPKYSSTSGDRVREYKLAESEFVLRGLRNNKQIKWQNISQRIIRLSEQFGWEKTLTATNVAYSGQLYMAEELMNNGMDIDEAISVIIKRFGINDNPSAQFYLRERIEKYLKLNK
ncbi:phage integrase family protein [Bacillus sp. ISTL8]|uniref:phage integrase family protein n=1 Tax=Bacillus sp. ISTL8 TaxID=2596896 RepID=UPI001456870A|nr:phage integrase family protein [Bacillus sp. ISTL8]